MASRDKIKSKSRIPWFFWFSSCCGLYWLHTIFMSSYGIVAILISKRKPQGAKMDVVHGIYFSSDFDFFFLMNPFHKNAYRFYALTFYFSWNDHLYGLLMDHEQVLVFYFEKGSKGDPNSEIFYILLFNTWNSKTRQMSKIQWV